MITVGCDAVITVDCDAVITVDCDAVITVWIAMLCSYCDHCGLRCCDQCVL